MGYGHYVYDGKECGYNVSATCEEPGCSERIDRGMAFACGGEPGEYEDYCAGYFCLNHLEMTSSDHGGSSQRCARCAAAISDEECEDCDGYPFDIDAAARYFADREEYTTPCSTCGGSGKRSIPIGGEG